MIEPVTEGRNERVGAAHLKAHRITASLLKKWGAFAMTRYLWILAVIAIALVTAVGDPSGANAQCNTYDPITGRCSAEAEPLQCQPIARDWTNDFFNLWGALAAADVNRLGGVRNCLAQNPVLTGKLLGLTCADLPKSYRGVLTGKLLGDWQLDMAAVPGGEDLHEELLYYEGCLQFCQCKRLAFGGMAGALCNSNCTGLQVPEYSVFE